MIPASIRKDFGRICCLPVVFDSRTFLRFVTHAGFEILNPIFKPILCENEYDLSTTCHVPTPVRLLRLESFPLEPEAARSLSAKCGCHARGKYRSLHLHRRALRDDGRLESPDDFRRAVHELPSPTAAVPVARHSCQAHRSGEDKKEDKKGSGLFFGSASGACCRFETKANGTANGPFVITKGHAAFDAVTKRAQLGLRLNLIHPGTPVSRRGSSGIASQRRSSTRWTRA